MPLFPAPTPSGPNLYLPQGWDAAWKAAKANAGSQRVNVVGIGDSIMAGQNSTDIMVDSFWAKLRAGVLAANGSKLGGDHYGLLYSFYYGLPTATYPIVVSGTGADNAGYYAGFNYANFGGQTTQTPNIRCTPPYQVTAFDIWYIDYSTGTWNYNVDGGANTTVNCTGPGTGAGCIVKKVSITGLTLGTHTLNINTTSSGSNTCNILGVTAYVGTTGLCFANMAFPGMGIFTGQQAHNALNDSTQFPPGRLALYQGYQGTTAAPTALSGLGFPTQPDLALLTLGVNDANQGVTRAQFRDALDGLVWSLRFGKNDACSIVIMAPWTTDGVLTTATTVADQDYTLNVAYNYRDIQAAMVEVAQVHGCAYVDIHSAFGRQPVANGWIHNASDIHPTPAGYLKMANLINSIL